MTDTTTLGAHGPKIGRIGLGAMGMSHGYDPHGRDDARSIAVIHRAIDIGVTLIDTADAYGPHTNEELVGRAIADRRDRVVLSTKGGLVTTESGGIGLNGRPEHLRAAVDASLRRLGVEHIDLYFLHRVDPTVRVEESWGALADMARSGKLGRLGISAATLDEVKRAESVHEVTAIQSEFSLFNRAVMADVLPYAVGKGIAFMPYSPLGRGLLTGAFNDRARLPKDDWRLKLPQFSEAVLAANRAIVDAVAAVGQRHAASPGQVALAWLLSKGPYVIPIPGTKTERYLEDNAGAAALRLTADELAELDALPLPTLEAA